MGAKILIADNDENVSEVSKFLYLNGYLVTVVKNSEDALRFIKEEKPDLILLEVMFKELDGFSLCKLIRSEGIKTPIMFLTSQTSEMHAVIGLELGAQDYIRKPVQFKELLARIDCQLKKQIGTIGNKKIVLNELEIDDEEYKVVHKGQSKNLSLTEFKLLKTLARKPNKVFSRKELLNSIWGLNDYKETRTVDIHIGYLRKKFEDNPKRPRILKTIRGVGYVLECA